MSTTETTTSIELVIQQTPSVALLDPVKKEELYAFLEREIAAFVPDLSTEASRKKIAALAYKVARTKTAIDDAGAELKAEALKKSQIIDAGRKEIRDRLDEMKARVRKPLTDWEEAEAARIKFVEYQITLFKQAPNLLATDTADRASAILSALVRVREEARLAADKKHRGAVMGTAKAALIEHAKLTEDQAKTVVLAIVANEIPGVTLSFSK